MISPLVEKALKAIESEKSKVVSEGFLTLAEVVAVNRIQDFHSDIIPEANKEFLEWGPLEKIQDSVKSWIERNPDHLHVASAFWVLDKFRDESLRPFLRHWLQRYINRIQPHLSVVGQILVDLESLDDRAISGDSYSATGHGKNLEDAIRYLNATKPKANE